MNVKFDDLGSCNNCSVQKICKFKEYIDESFREVEEIKEEVTLMEGNICVDAIIKVNCEYQIPICGGESE